MSSSVPITSLRVIPILVRPCLIHSNMLGPRLARSSCVILLRLIYFPTGRIAITPPSGFFMILRGAIFNELKSGMLKLR